MKALSTKRRLGRTVEEDGARNAGAVRQYLADYRLICFARDLLETRSIAAAVRKET